MLSYCLPFTSPARDFDATRRRRGGAGRQGVAAPDRANGGTEERQTPMSAPDPPSRINCYISGEAGGVGGSVRGKGDGWGLFIPSGLTRISIKIKKHCQGLTRAKINFALDRYFFDFYSGLL